MANNQDPAQYLLTLEQMIENEYPIPSYMADVFEKPDDCWLETPEPVKPDLLDDIPEKGKEPPKAKIYAIDCEMASSISYRLHSQLTFAPPVYDGRWQGADSS